MEDRRLSRRLVGAALALCACALAGCGADPTQTSTVTKTVSGATVPAETTEPEHNSNLVTVETTTEDAITEDEVKDVYDEFIHDAIRGDTDSACDAMTEKYRDEFVKHGNASTQVDLKGEDCQTVMRKAAALISTSYRSDPAIEYSDFKSAGNTATIVTSIIGQAGPDTIGISVPTTITFIRDGDDVKMASDSN